MIEDPFIEGYKLGRKDASSVIAAQSEELRRLRQEVETKGKDAERYHELATPEIHDFMVAVEREAAHQRDRWENGHDSGKSPEDWLWLIAYLSVKATQANRYGDQEKYLHHIITCAAACCNWHANASGSKDPE